jgi:Cu(I)/Ag(I) efflux system membrane protein CusA/SilA
MDVATTFEERERYRVNVRYPRELRDNVEALRNVLVPIAPMAPRPLPIGRAVAAGAPTPGLTGGSSIGSGMGAMGGGGMTPSRSGSAMGGGAMEDAGMGGATQPSSRSAASDAAFVPLGQLARVETVMGPPMIKSEMGAITGWVYVDIDTEDVGGYVRAAKAEVDRQVKLPPGYLLKWTGQFELLQRVRARMIWILPLTIAIVFFILYVNFKGTAQALIVMTSVPFAAVGAIWILWFAHFNTSIAVWVGMIALLGVAAETASVMVVYLDDAWNEGRANGSLRTVDDLLAQSLDAGAKRVRPMLMTVMTNVFGLLPILVDRGVGSDVAKRIAAPMWGGLVSLTILTLLVIPAVYVVWRTLHLHRAAEPPTPSKGG